MTSAELEKIEKRIDALLAPDELKRHIKECLSSGSTVKSGTSHLVLTGNLGIDRASFAKDLSKIYYDAGLLKNGIVHAIKGTDLIEKTKYQIEKAMGGILFVDQADVLRHDSGKNAMAALTKAMSSPKEKTIVIIADKSGKFSQIPALQPLVCHFHFDAAEIKQLKKQDWDIFVTNSPDLQRPLAAESRIRLFHGAPGFNGPQKR